MERTFGTDPFEGSYRDIELSRYGKFYRTREGIRELRNAIDGLYSNHPEYFTNKDEANIFRELTEGRGPGKSHMSGKLEGEPTGSGLYGVPRRAREKSGQRNKIR